MNLIEEMFQDELNAIVRNILGLRVPLGTLNCGAEADCGTGGPDVDWQKQNSHFPFPSLFVAKGCALPFIWRAVDLPRYPDSPRVCSKPL